MPILLSWSVIATVLVAMASAEYNGLLWGQGSSEASILLWVAILIGAPAWLSVAVLTIKRSRETSKILSAIQNAPAIIGAIIFGVNYYLWW